MTPTAAVVAVLPLAAAVALGASVVLVSRLECLADRWALSEAGLGLLVAFAANMPEFTAAIAALLHRHATIGVGVALGSNAFNLATLLGLSAIVASRIDFHRRAVALEGAAALWVATVTVLAVSLRWHPWIALVLVAAIVVPYLALSLAPVRTLRLVGAPVGAQRFLVEAIAEEEADLTQGIHPRRGRRHDGLVAVVAIAVVVASSAALERASEVLGARFHLTDLVVGGLWLAALTSLPNAVGAVFLAKRQRGAAVLSEATNSNVLNVVVGLLVPGVVLGVGHPGSSDLLVALAYVALTILCVAFTRRGRLTRGAGWVLVAGYLAFVGLAATW